MVVGCNKVSALMTGGRKGETEEEWETRSLEKRSRHWGASMLEESSLCILKCLRTRAGKSDRNWRTEGQRAGVLPV